MGYTSCDGIYILRGVDKICIGVHFFWVHIVLYILFVDTFCYEKHNSRLHFEMGYIRNGKHFILGYMVVLAKA